MLRSNMYTIFKDKNINYLQFAKINFKHLSSSPPTRDFPTEITKYCSIPNEASTSFSLQKCL